MVRDRTGFDFPEVDLNQCVHCGRCTSICPLLHERGPAHLPAAFAAWNRDAAVRRDSTSGGAFTAIADYVLVGGGVGIPPLYGLAKRLTAQGKRVTAVLGFNRESEIFLAEEFRALGAEVIVATADGSAGIKGLVTDGMAAVSDYTYLYTLSLIHLSEPTRLS